MSIKSVFPKPIYLGAATRTPIGKFGRSLKRFSAPQLATLALQNARSRAPEVDRVDAVILGHARQAGAGPNPARQATVFSGLGNEVPAFTVNQACASGLLSIITAAEKISLSRVDSIWAGGVESMSNTPYLLTSARWGQKLGNAQVVDGMYQDGFQCPMADMLMGATVENYIAKEKNISRKDQDEYALRSQQLAEKTWASGGFSKETFEIPAEAKIPALREDEHRRSDTTLDSLSKLAPVFDVKNGSVTAGNSSGITDGAAWLHVGSAKAEHAQAELIDYESIALDPKYMGLGPVAAIAAILRRQGLLFSDIEHVEINEAFAAQVLACQRELNIPLDILNPRGGSIALGHPIGCTGTRISVTLIHALSGKPGALGLASLCVSGGMGVAVLLRSLY
jgi:acetyl-CoA C-acetyltransferase